jgi:hypothetical protein
MYIAKSDFPQRWPNLLPELFGQLQVPLLLAATCALSAHVANAVQHKQRTQ